MRAEKLLSMANQISSFFRAYPQEEAISGIHEHVTAFWTPVMISTLRQHLMLDSTGADNLVTLAIIRKPDAESPVRDVLSPGPQAGQMASDAG